MRMTLDQMQTYYDRQITRLQNDVTLRLSYPRQYQRTIQKLVADKHSLDTIKAILPKQLVNASKNIEIEYGDLKDLLGRWKAKTAIAVSFGPSLRNNIDELIRVKDKYKIIAVDRGYRWLDEKGIVPDVVCTCDVNISAQHIPDVVNENTILIAHVGANHEYVSEFVKRGGKKVYYFVSAERFKSHLAIIKHTGIIDVINFGGCVGNCLITVALDIFGVRKLLLAGYDYSFYRDRYYPDTDAMPQENATPTKDINGNDALITFNLYQYAQYAADYVNHKQAHDKIVNCTGGGIFDIPLKDSLSKY